MSKHDYGFEAAVRNEFDVLCKQHEFTCLCSEPTKVIYASRSAEIAITYDPYSYEIDIEIKKRGSQQSFPLMRLIELSSPDEAKRWECVQASSEQDINALMPQLAGLLVRFGQAVLQGQPAPFQQMAELDERIAAKTTRELKLRQARSEAENAWHSKEYEKVVTALTPVKGELTSAELAKLEYAEKQLSKGL